jgi:phosphoacetylglucosamine mutase
MLKYLPTSKEGGIDIKVVNDDVLRPEALNFEVRHIKYGW